MLRAFSLAALAASGLVVAGCGSERSDDLLTGRVTVAAQPANQITVTVVGAEGKEGSGLTNREGTYRIENPPKGKLTFVLSTFVPPPPPGTPAAPIPPGTVKVPEKYTKPGNGLSFDYSGGRQKYDIDLNP